MRYASLAVAVASLVGGCSILEDEVNRGFAQREPITAVTFTTADVRIITRRNRPYPGSSYVGSVVCTEPSPDVAKAISAAAALSASVANKGSGAAGGASAEAVAELAGRSTALLGLRDGIYRACEAYANGVIGADAYALVLSRYGQLMTTLFLGQDVTGAAGTERGATVQSPPVTVNLPGAASVNAGQAADPPPAGANPAAAPPKTLQTPPVNPGSPAPQAAAPASAGPPSTAPLALTRIDEDYLNLSYNLDWLVIACVNYYDPTRIFNPPGNSWLVNICSQINSLKVFEDLGKAAVALVKGQVLASPVNPVVRAPQTPSDKAAPQKKVVAKNKPAIPKKPVAAAPPVAAVPGAAVMPPGAAAAPAGAAPPRPGERGPAGAAPPPAAGAPAGPAQK